MSWRFRVKLGPFVYDEKLGEYRDNRPSLLTGGDIVVLFLCSIFLAGAVVMAVITS
jgi:hypothetical protein